MELMRSLPRFCILAGLKQDISVVSFDNFRTAFLFNLHSPLFADSDNSRPVNAGISAATKELRKKNGYAIFTAAFLESIYEILTEHSELKDEQAQVKESAKKLNSKLAAMQNEMAAVRAFSAHLERLAGNTAASALANCRYRLQTALVDYEAEIRRNQEHFNSLVNPAVRKRALGKVRWEPALKLDNYSLQSLEKKAPDKWVYEQLDEALKREMWQISAITRYRVMSALLEAVGVNIQPITFKLHRRRNNRGVLSGTKS
jgi:hypothetical protein